MSNNVEVTIVLVLVPGGSDLISSENLMGQALLLGLKIGDYSNDEKVDPIVYEDVKSVEDATEIAVQEGRVQGVMRKGLAKKLVMVIQVNVTVDYVPDKVKVDEYDIELLIEVLS